MSSTAIEHVTNNAVTVAEVDAGGPLRPADVVHQVTLIQEVMSAVMKNGEHYGTIPGCGSKPTLLKPGAEKLAMTFRLAPTIEIQERELPGGHREYLVTVRLVSVVSGQVMGEGVGSCSTMESKYRYRNIADYVVTGEEIPADAKAKKDEYRRKGFGMKRVDGVWEWVRYTDAARVENPDIADVYNTVLKMAKKRALVDAVLTTTAASDIFTQDIEDLPPDAAMSTPQVVVEPTPDPTPSPEPIETEFSVAPAADARKATKPALDKMHKLIAEVGLDSDKLAEILEHDYQAGTTADLTVPQAKRLIERLEKKLAEVM